MKNFHEAVRTHFSGAVPHARECGIQITTVDAGGAEGVLPFRPEFLGDIERGVIHTGVIATLIDTLMGLSVLGAIGDFDTIATLDLRMDYLRPALAGKAVHSRAECYRMTRSICFVRATAWQENRDEPLAVGQAAFMRSPNRATGPVNA
jgi:uncharacterized protein (TIGR00369 family)